MRKMAENDFIVCALCIHKRIKCFHRIRDLHTHLTMYHGVKIRILVDDHGTVKVLGTNKHR